MVVGEEHLDIVYRAGTITGRNTDKWNMLGLKPLESISISTPGIDGAYGVIECKLQDKIDAGECSIFICEVLTIRVDKEKYTRYGWDFKKTKLLHIRGRAFTLPGRLVFAERR
ncbi:MAG: flavin reductase [Desulfurococcales archaeon]|nr:flavin reductase [Desulfurococcales archaeon]